MSKIVKKQKKIEKMKKFIKIFKKTTECLKMYIWQKLSKFFKIESNFKHFEEFWIKFWKNLVESLKIGKTCQNFNKNDRKEFGKICQILMKLIQEVEIDKNH